MSTPQLPSDRPIKEGRGGDHHPPDTPRQRSGARATNASPSDSTTTRTRQDATSRDDSTAVPLAVNIVGAAALHRLNAAGYRVAGVCRCCGAPLVNVASVARGLGPVCAARTGGDL